MVKFSIKCRMFDFSYGITEENMGWSNKVFLKEWKLGKE